MRRAYVACATLTLALGAFAGCKKSPGTTGGSGGTGGATSANPQTGSTQTGATSTHATTTGGPTTTTGSQATSTAMSSSSSGMQVCTMTYTNIPKGKCDLLAQDCMGTATCAPFNDNMGGTTTDCSTMIGVKGPGAPCANPGECDKGLICIGTMNGYCGAVCCPGGTCAGGGSCNTMVGTGDTKGSYFSACSYSPACALFQPNACAAGLNCNWESQGLTTCNGQAQPPVAEGGHCTHLNDCGNMQGCFGPTATMQVCRYMCQMGSAAAPGLGGCPTGQTCQAAQIGINNVGVCGPSGG